MEGSAPRSDVPGRLLLVDDEEYILRSIKRVLRRGRWEIETATDGRQALERLEAFRPEVVISDFRMPGMNGVELLSEVKARSPRTQRIMLTGQADQHAIEDAINRSEIFRFVSKPWNDQQLVLTVTSAFEQYALLRENERLYRLTQAQNEELRQLNAGLEARVLERTRALMVAKREWELSFDALQTPLMVVQRDHHVRRANRAAGALALVDVNPDRRPSCHRFLLDQEAPCAACPIARALDTGKPQRAELSVGTRTYVVSSHPMAGEDVAVCTYDDVTGQRELNRRLLESEKMAAVGQLAGGVAHEINNPLGGILAFAQLMQRDAGRSKADLESLQLIEESAVRCKRIVDSLLRLSRRSRVEDRRPFELSRCVEDAAYLFRAQLKSAPRATLETTLASGLPELHGDPAQLAQVVLNLLQNALQALPDRVGEIALTTGAHSDRELFFSVRDTGTGIPADHLPHIFEPSFTTKPPGEGTGLGLAIAYRIVQDHHGAFDVDTRVGRGSTFTVRIPVPLETEPSRQP